MSIKKSSSRAYCFCLLLTGLLQTCFLHATEFNALSFDGINPTFLVNSDESVTLAYQNMEGNQTTVKHIPIKDGQLDWNNSQLIATKPTLSNISNLASSGFLGTFLGFFQKESPVTKSSSAECKETLVQHYDAYFVLYDVFPTELGKYNYIVSDQHQNPIEFYHQCGISRGETDLIVSSDTFAYTPHVENGAIATAVSVDAPMINSGVPPYAGILDEMLILSSNETSDGYQEVCLMKPGLKVEKCVNLPADFSPPYHPAIISSQLGSNGYSARAIIANERHVEAYAISKNNKILNFDRFWQFDADGSLSVPVMIETGMRSFTGQDDGNTMSIFALSAGTEPVLNGWHFSLDDIAAHQTVKLPVNGLTMAKTMTPGILVEDLQSDNSTEQSIHLYYTAQEGIFHFYTENDGNLKFDQTFPTPAFSGLNLTVTHTHATSNRIVALAGNGQQWRMTEIPLHGNAIKSSARQRFNNHAVKTGLEVYVDPALSALGDWECWTLGYYIGEDIFTLNNEYVNSNDCGINQSKNHLSWGCSPTGPNRIIYLSNKFMQNCFNLWQKKADNETMEFYLFYLEDNLGWKRAGRKFALYVGDVRSTVDYLWRPVRSEIINTELSSPRLVSEPGRKAGYRYLFIDSREFESSPADVPEYLSTWLISAIAVGGTVLVVVIVTASAVICGKKPNFSGYNAIQ